MSSIPSWGVFSPLTSEAFDKSSRWLWKDSCLSIGVKKARKHMCITDHHDMTLAVKVALNPINTINQSNGRIVHHRVGNNITKGESDGHQHFLLFLQCFQKASLQESSNLDLIRW